MIDKRALYAEKLKRNVDKWNVEINNFEAKVDQAKSEVQAEYRKHVEELKVQHRDLEAKMLDLQKTGKEAWADMKSGVDLARRTLGDSIEKAKSRFN